MKKYELCGMSRAELESFVQSELGEKAYRASQIRSWLMRGAEVQEMTNLPQTLRERLQEIAVANPVKIDKCFASRTDGTEKYLYALQDGNLIEGVLMRYRYGDTLCVSTQVGCRMGCAFCASTLEGRVRDLTPGEMLGQVLAVNRHMRESGMQKSVHNAVLMGSGEPLDNYANVMRFLRLLNDPEGLNISLRNVSLSTCGLVPAMERLAEEGLPVTLSLSLHAPNDAIRKRIMPIANSYTVDQALQACRNYVNRTGRRVVLEYALIRGVNDSLACADELAGRLRGLQCHVNLIPLNDVPERDLRAPLRREVESFQKRLEQRHISVTVRREMGADIEGACGQLRRRVISDRH